MFASNRRFAWNPRRTGVLAVIAVACATALACHDVVSSSPPLSDASMMQPNGIPGQLSAREERAVDQRGPQAKAFHRRNRMSWVGDGHNRGIEAYFADRRLRKPTSSNICRDVIEFFDRTPQSYASDLSLSTADSRARAHRQGARLVPCGRTGDLLRPVVMRIATVAEDEPVTLSSTASALIHDIGTAVTVAGSPEELAGVLNGLLERTSQLSADEAMVVEALAAVAQSSYEYWDANFMTVGNELAQQLAAEQVDCQSWEGGDSCWSAVSADGPASRLSPFRVALSSCGLEGWRASTRDIVLADFVGAISGVLSSAWKGWALQLLGGAASASAIVMAWNVTIDLICWLQSKWES